jgi:hypothetical protein
MSTTSSRLAMKSRKVSVCACSSCRRNSSLYSSVRRRSSAVAPRESSSHVCRSSRIACGASCGHSSVRISGQAARTSAHSTGLSSMKTKLSRPRLSRSAIARRFADFGCQLMAAATMCSRRSAAVGTALEHPPDVRLLVLAAERDQHAVSGEARQRVVQRLRGPRRTIEALRRPLADDAAPQRVVAVHATTLRAGASRRCTWRMTIVASVWK